MAHTNLGDTYSENMKESKGVPGPSDVHKAFPAETKAEALTYDTKARLKCLPDNPRRSHD